MVKGARSDTGTECQYFGSVCRFFLFWALKARRRQRAERARDGCALVQTKQARADFLSFSCHI